MRAAASKIIPAESIAEAVAARRARGDRVVLACGSFQLLSQAWIRWVEQARQAASDIVIASVLDEPCEIAARDDRALLVAALRAVDHVVLTRDWLALLEALHPDVCRVSPSTGQLDLDLVRKHVGELQASEEPHRETAAILERLRR